MATETLSPKTHDPILDEGGHDRFSHIVRKGDANRGYIGGEVIEALCGKRWIPSHNPERYPVCKTCLEVAHSMRPPGS